jgi:hypothetical protein
MPKLKRLSGAEAIEILEQFIDRLAVIFLKQNSFPISISSKNLIDELGERE